MWFRIILGLCILNPLALGAGIPFAFFLFQLMSTAASGLENLKYVTINALFDTQDILVGEGYAIKLTILAVIGLVFILSVLKYVKKKVYLYKKSYDISTQYKRKTRP